MRTDYYYHNCHQLVMAQGGPVATVIMLVANVYQDSGINSLPTEVGKLVKKMLDDVDCESENFKNVIEVKANSLGMLGLTKELRMLWRNIVGSKPFLTFVKKNFFPSANVRTSLLYDNWDSVPFTVSSKTGKVNPRYEPTLHHMHQVKGVIKNAPVIAVETDISAFLDKLRKVYSLQKAQGKVSANVEALLLLIGIRAASAPDSKIPKYLANNFDTIVATQGGTNYIPLTVRHLRLNRELDKDIIRYMSNVEDYMVNSFLRKHYIKSAINNKPRLSYLQGTNYQHVPFILLDDGTVGTSTEITKAFVMTKMTWR